MYKFMNKDFQYKDVEFQADFFSVTWTFLIDNVYIKLPPSGS